MPVSQEVKGCGCRPLVRPQRQLAEGTCDFRATHSLSGLLLFFSSDFFLHWPCFRLITLSRQAPLKRRLPPRARSTNNYRSLLGQKEGLSFNGVCGPLVLYSTWSIMGLTGDQREYYRKRK